MRRLLVHAATVGLAVAGSQLAHTAVYRIVEPSADQRAHLLADTGHAYLHYMPLALALLSVLVVLALFSEARLAGGGAAGAGPRLWTFAVIAPATFACQEVFERMLHDGAMPWGAPLERTFLLGLALQLPFAIGAYALARLLLGAAHVVGRLLAAPRPPAARLAVAAPLLVALRLPHGADARPGGGPRAPPVLAA